MMNGIRNLFFVICFFFGFNNVYSSGNNIKASYFRNKADSLVKIIDNNSKLLFVNSDSVDIIGTSYYWIYCYTSIDSPKYYYFHTDIDSVAFDSISYNILVGPRWISRSWIDSDSAMFLAELQGGSEFRALNPNYRITATLSESVVPPPSPPEWYITYISNENPNNKKLIIIDATYSPTNIPSLKDNAYSPENYVLYQNFPNPFNPSTVIKFNLPKFSRVILKIYNLTGREIETLINDYQPEGMYEIKWQPAGLPSGIYFYTIQAGKFKETKKLLLQK